MLGPVGVVLLGALTLAAPTAHKVHKVNSTFSVTSKDMVPGKPISEAQVYNGGMGCSGQNLSPALSWTNAPSGTKSFAITMYDPDAPTGSGWWHWVVYNIPISTTSLMTGAGDASKNLLPPGAVQGNTDFGTPGYGGPCPPQGDKPHRYFITIYALNTDAMAIPPAATAANVGFNIHAHTIGKATLTARYGR